jgi:hypothetical protein
MKLETAKAIIEQAEINSFEMELREYYSGRCMYGKDTSGIVFGSMGDLLRSVAEAAVELYRQDQEDDGKRYEEFVADLPERTDSMGLDTIVY